MKENDELYYSMRLASIHYRAYELFEKNRTMAFEIIGCNSEKKIKLTPEEFELIDRYIFNK